VGGACAIASADVASNAQTINSERFVCMRTQPRSEASVPKMRANLSGWTAPARLRAKVPFGPEWLHEIKYDAFRHRVERDGDRVRLITRGSYDLAEALIPGSFRPR
jgi:ATP-dependent DNA ligase